MTMNIIVSIHRIQPQFELSLVVATVLVFLVDNQKVISFTETVCTVVCVI